LKTLKTLNNPVKYNKKNIIAMLIRAIIMLIIIENQLLLKTTCVFSTTTCSVNLALQLGQNLSFSLIVAPQLGQNTINNQYQGNIKMLLIKKRT